MIIELDKSRKLVLPNFDPELVLEDLGIKIAYVIGDNIMCHCCNPQNHKNGDANPSFGYSISKKVWNCFTCGTGTILSLIRDQIGLSSGEAENWLKERLVSENKPKKIKRIKSKEIMEYPSNLLFRYRKIHPYLYERGLTKEVIIDMQIGYDENHDGIMIPHFFNKKLVGWQVRHLFQDKNGKYLCNSCNKKIITKYSSTPNFPKRNTLFNYDKAMECVRKTGEKMIVVESPMTALRLISEGYKSVVATFGSWSREQIFSLSGCQNGIILWADADLAGQTNLKRVLDWAVKLVPTYIAPLVDKEKGDAGDLTSEEIKLYLENIYSPILYKLKGLQKGGDMGFQKFGDSKKINKLSEKESQVIEDFKVKTGKTIQDLNDEERKEFRASLDEVKTILDEAK